MTEPNETIYFDYEAQMAGSDKLLLADGSKLIS